MLSPLQLSGGSTVALGLLACGLAVAGVVSYTCTWSSKSESSKAGRVPYLPSWIPLLGNTVELARNVDRHHEWVAEHSLQRDGKPFALRLPGKNDTLFLSRPEHFEEVVKTQSSNFSKGDIARDLRRFPERRHFDHPWRALAVPSQDPGQFVHSRERCAST